MLWVQLGFPWSWCGFCHGSEWDDKKIFLLLCWECDYILILSLLERALGVCYSGWRFWLAKYDFFFVWYVCQTPRSCWKDILSFVTARYGTAFLEQGLLMIDNEFKANSCTCTWVLEKGKWWCVYPSTLGHSCIQVFFFHIEILQVLCWT